MKLTVEAFAQEQKSHPVQVEIVAASWTFAERGQKSDQYQNSHPDAKQSPHGPVGGRNSIGNQQCGNIHTHCGEKIFAASSCLFQDIHVRRRVDRTVIHSFPPAVHRWKATDLFSFSEKEIPDRKNRLTESYKQKIWYNNTDAVINQ
jgi:hypothetical protein